MWNTVSSLKTSIKLSHRFRKISLHEEILQRIITENKILGKPVFLFDQKHPKETTFRLRKKKSSKNKSVTNMTIFGRKDAIVPGQFGIKLLGQ